MLSKHDYVPGAISEALRVTSDNKGQGQSPSKKTAVDKTLHDLFSKPVKPAPTKTQVEWLRLAHGLYNFV